MVLKSEQVSATVYKACDNSSVRVHTSLPSANNKCKDMY